MVANNAQRVWSFSVRTAVGDRDHYRGKPMFLYHLQEESPSDLSTQHRGAGQATQIPVSPCCSPWGFVFSAFRALFPSAMK